MTTLAEELDGGERYRARRNGNGNGDARTIIAWMALIVTLAGLIFTAGYNWRRIDEVALLQARDSDEMRTNYMRKDVTQYQMLALDGKLDDLKTQIAELKRELERDRR